MQLKKAVGLEIGLVEAGYIAHQPIRDCAWHLNHAATLVLEMCTGTNSPREIAAALEAAFGLDTPLDAEVFRLLNAMAAAGLVDGCEAGPINSPEREGWTRRPVVDGRPVLRLIPRDRRSTARKALGRRVLDPPAIELIKMDTLSLVSESSVSAFLRRSRRLGRFRGPSRAAIREALRRRVPTLIR